METAARGVCLDGHLHTSCRHQQDGGGFDSAPEDCQRVPVRTSSKRGILTNALANESDLPQTHHVLTMDQKMREEFISVLTAYQAVHDSTGDDPVELGSLATGQEILEWQREWRLAWPRKKAKAPRNRTRRDTRRLSSHA